jgi:DNA polymerase III sliding clamp (beta) subunit (PCNA family)
VRILITDIPAFKAVLSVAPKNDVRFYLNSLLFDTSNKRLVATNGHLLAWAEIIDESDINDNVIIGFAERSIPAKTKSILLTDDGLVCYSDGIPHSESKIRIIPTHIIDAEYPNYQKLMQPTSERGPVTHTGVNPNYIHCIAKHDKSASVFMRFRAENDAIDLEFSGDISSVKAVLMPMRVDPEKVAA